MVKISCIENATELVVRRKTVKCYKNTLKYRRIQLTHFVHVFKFLALN